VIGIRRAALVVTGLVALGLVFAGSAGAEEVVLRDGEGRAIRFDVRAAGVDAGWYAGLLRRAAHADEIEDVTIRIVDWPELRDTCGRGAAGCYRRSDGRGLVVVPAGKTRDVAATLVHEYGHHVDGESQHGGVREPNGTRHWWRVRGLARLVELRSVARSYRLGWDRSIAEIFAEDYAYLNLRDEYRIGWLQPPDATTRQAIRADLGLAAAPTAGDRAPTLRPVVISRSGLLEPAGRESVRFGLLGPGRRVAFTASVGAGAGAGPLARLAIVCDGSTIRSRMIGGGALAASIVLPRFGPASRCEAVLTNTGRAARAYRFRVQLSVPR